jgi:hypothetical protein
MTKEQLQQFVTKDGIPLDLNSFNWCGMTSTFSTNRDNLVIDFRRLGDINIITGDECDVRAGSGVYIQTGDDCNIKVDRYNHITTGYSCNILAGVKNVIRTCSNTTIDAEKDSIAIRIDHHEIIPLNGVHKIKLKTHFEQGYEIIN